AVAVKTEGRGPVAPQPRAGLCQAGRNKSEELMRLGIQAQAAGNISEAATQFEAATRVDDACAELQFRLGRCLLALGDKSGGQKALQRACDLDTLRFRCDSRLNELSRQAAAGREGERILLADAEAS